MVATAQRKWSYAASIPTETAAGLIRVLGKPDAMRMLCLVWNQPLCVEFCTRVARMSRSRVSRGFRELYGVGLVRMRQEGRYRFYWRVTRGMHPVFANFMRLAKWVAWHSSEVALDRSCLGHAKRGWIEVSDLPWPKEDEWGAEEEEEEGED